MKKIETIWHYILFSALQGDYKHTQTDLAKRFSYSLSTVNHALNVPTSIGAIRKTSRFFVLNDFTKLLYCWASVRNFEKDIIYTSFYDGTVTEIEGLVNPEAIYACYSAGRNILKESPADYSKVYFYIPEEFLDNVKNRFPEKSKKGSNIFVLKMPKSMLAYGNITTLPQTFVDIWNLRDWYSKDFVKSLEEKINGILS